MSVRVNLIPREVEERNRAARQRAVAALAGLGFVVILALGYFWQVSKVNDAQARLEAEQAELSRLQAELSSLQEFQELESRAETATALLGVVLGDEVSLAGVLQDIAAVMPSDSQIDSMSISITDVAEGTGLRPSLGSVTMTGKTLRGHAPGLERFLLEFDKVAVFDQVFFRSSTLDEDGVATFSVDFQLGPEILTGRYLEGLPEGVR